VTDPTPEQIKELIDAIEVIEYSETYERFKSFKPHPKQRAHLDLGLARRERLLMAGNRNGKTETGAFEAACHLTGDYPDKWKGRVFEQPTMGWICGETSLLVRDVQQKKLCGPPGVDSMFGTGMIPKDSFADKPSLARGVTDAYDTIQVRHKSGGISIGRFKSYEQGRQKFQGEGLDWIWFDEEPPLDIYAEGIARIGERDGISWLTFTPLKGRSAVVLRFLDDPSLDRGITTMTLDDALHIPVATRAKMLTGYLVHEREARARGVPTLGSGRIFMASEESIIEAAIEHIPPFWKKLWGVDFGIDHPFAAVLILWDVDNDVIHVHHTIRIADALPLQHAAAMRPIGINVPVAWPQDGTQRRDDGKPLSDHYKRCGLKMLSEHATWDGPHGGVSTEAGIIEMDERERTGRLKVAAHLSDYFEERRFYHRKDGQIVKLKDDILSATRIAVMMKRMARAVGLGGQAAIRESSGGIADGTDFPLF
jgi:phage terminase large subunit-like protein